MIRSFIGIPVPPDTAKALEPFQIACPLGKPVRAENLHLTLAFLDDQPEYVLRDLHDGLAEIVTSSFEIRLNGPEVLGGHWPGAVAISADGGDAVSALFRKVSQAARDAAIPLPRRRFRPHVTLNRINRDPDPVGRAKLQEYLETATTEPITFRAYQFSLVQSRLTPDGAIYEPLAEYPLT